MFRLLLVVLLLEVSAEDLTAEQSAHVEVYDLDHVHHDSHHHKPHSVRLGDVHTHKTKVDRIVSEMHNPDYVEPITVLDYRYLKTGGRDYTRGAGGQILVLPKGVRIHEKKEFDNFDEMLHFLREKSLAEHHTHHHEMSKLGYTHEGHHMHHVHLHGEHHHDNNEHHHDHHVDHHQDHHPGHHHEHHLGHHHDHHSGQHHDHHDDHNRVRHHDHHHDHNRVHHHDHHRDHNRVHHHDHHPDHHHAHHLNHHHGHHHNDHAYHRISGLHRGDIVYGSHKRDAEDATQKPVDEIPVVEKPDEDEKSASASAASASDNASVVAEESTETEETAI